MQGYLMGGNNRGRWLELDNDVPYIQLLKNKPELPSIRLGDSESSPNNTLDVETYHYVATTDSGTRMYLIEDQW